MDMEHYFVIPNEVFTPTPALTLVRPIILPTIAHWDDCAADSVVDFQRIEPLVIEQSKRMYDARVMMEKNKLHLTLVHDEKGLLVGTLSLAEILSENTLRLIEQRRIAARSEIDVKTVMRPLAQCLVLEYHRLQHAKVGNLIKTLHHNQTNYALVFERAQMTGNPCIRGVVLTGLVSDQLGQNVRFKPIQSESQSFYDLQHGLS